MLRGCFTAENCIFNDPAKPKFTGVRLDAGGSFSDGLSPTDDECPSGAGLIIGEEQFRGEGFSVNVHVGD